MQVQKTAGRATCLRRGMHPERLYVGGAYRWGAELGLVREFDDDGMHINWVKETGTKIEDFPVCELTAASAHLPLDSPVLQAHLVPVGARTFLLNLHFG